MFFGQHPNEWMLFFQDLFFTSVATCNNAVKNINQSIESTLLSFFMTYLLICLCHKKLTITCSIFLTFQIWDTIRDVIFLQGKKYYIPSFKQNFMQLCTYT